MGVLGSAGGSYLAQSVVHSLVVALVVESLLRVWELRRPSARIRFRLLILALPVLAWPLFTLAYPARNSPEFREGMSLLHLTPWLELPLGAGFAVWHLFLLLLGATTVLFVVQEAIPWFQHRRFRRDGMRLVKKGWFPGLDSALAELAPAGGQPVPRVYLADHPEPVAYVVGLTNHALVLSESLLRRLDDQELKGVVAHEMAHLMRRDNWLSWALLIVRSLMFYNPVALWASRAIARDGERLCDDLATARTGQPLALASGLLKVFRTSHGQPQEARPGWRGSFMAWTEALDDHVQRFIAEDRVRRLLRPDRAPDPPCVNLRLGLTAACLAALVFFIV